jgi:hypothetical protein
MRTYRLSRAGCKFREIRCVGFMISRRPESSEGRSESALSTEKTAAAPFNSLNADCEKRAIVRGPKRAHDSSRKSRLRASPHTQVKERAGRDLVFVREAISNPRIEDACGAY